MIRGPEQTSASFETVRWNTTVRIADAHAKVTINVNGPAAHVVFGFKEYVFGQSIRYDIPSPS